MLAFIEVYKSLQGTPVLAGVHSWWPGLLETPRKVERSRDKSFTILVVFVEPNFTVPLESSLGPRP